MTRRAPALLVLLLAALALLPPPARGASSFTFYGSGYGHGLGMSQWGAYGLAQRGWGHGHILKHFYSHTRVQRTASPPRALRIGLAQGNRAFTMTAQDGPVELHVERKRGRIVGTIPAGQTWTVSPRRHRYLVRDAGGRAVGGRLWGGPRKDLFATYGGHAKVRVSEAGHTYNRGYVEFNLYSCGGGCRMRLILVVGSEPYLYGISEVPSSWPRSALEVQATAARTYAFSKARANQHRDVCNCALYATAADQVYAGWDKEGGIDGDRWVAAVRATRGRVVTYGGSLIQAFYSSSSGGHTENNENVWGGSPIPYLRGVCDPGDYTAANPSRVWTVAMSDDQVTSALGLGIGTVTDFSNVQRGVSGRIITVTVNGSGGHATISGTTLRVRLGLRDDRVWINSDRHVVGNIRAKYDRVRCKPGLPTSEHRAVPGGTSQRFQRGAIYHNDGRGATAWLNGPIYDEYRDAGGPTGMLGLPLYDPKTLTKARGCDTHRCSRGGFEHGAIYFKGTVGAHELHGAVLDYYVAHHGPRGSLGFPVTAVEPTGDGGHRARFEHGTVTCSSGGCTRS